MADAETLERREVPLADWATAVADARDAAYTFFDWLTAVDESDAEENPGFDIVCHLMDGSTPGALRRVLIRARVPDGSPVPSITGIFAGAAWHERETHEMFGIDFEGFDDGTGLGIRPLLLPDGFEGTPLRKSFVLAARASKPWPGAWTRRRPPVVLVCSLSPGSLAPGVPGPEWGPR